MSVLNAFISCLQSNRCGLKSREESTWKGLTFFVPLGTNTNKNNSLRVRNFSRRFQTECESKHITKDLVYYSLHVRRHVKFECAQQDRREKLSICASHVCVCAAHGCVRLCHYTEEREIFLMLSDLHLSGPNRQVQGVRRPLCSPPHTKHTASSPSLSTKNLLPALAFLFGSFHMRLWPFHSAPN
jgi:hypothetical protein